MTEGLACMLDEDDTLMPKNSTFTSYYIAENSFLINTKLQKMYPKVKVRTEGQGDQHAIHEHNWSSLLSLKDIQFLLLQDSCFPEYRDISPPPIARVPATYVPNIVLPTESASEDKKSSSSDEDKPNIRNSSVPRPRPNSVEDRPNIRASSVPRPRAVISSPDNDAMIGNKNRVKALQPSVLKNHNMVPSRHAQCKTVQNQATDGENPPSSMESKETTDNKIDLRVKKGSNAIVTPRRRRNITPGKTSSVRI